MRLHHKMRSSPPRGTTVSEILVALGVISLLTALFFPAVQASREEARRMHCLNNIRQIGLASQNHVSLKSEEFPYTATNGSDSQGRRLVASVSPHRNLLSLLDQAALAARLPVSINVINDPGIPPSSLGPLVAEIIEIRLPVFLCPSDVERPGATNYRANMGYGPGVYGPGPPAIAGFIGNTAGAFVHARSTHPSEFTDGLSSTVQFSEKLVGDGDPSRFTPWADYFYDFDHDISTANDAINACGGLAQIDPQHASYAGWTWLFGGWNSTWYNHVLTPNSAISDCSAGGSEMAGGGNGAYSARSFHRGGANASFADGSARFISDHIDSSVWRALASRGGADLPGDDW